MKTKINFVLILLVIMSVCLFEQSSYAKEELTVQTLDNQAKVKFQQIDENSVLVSVLDSQGNPVKGLTLDNFIVKKGIKKAKIIATEALETKKNISINIVLVVDNSYSMVDRKAVKPLLNALDEFVKIVRPFDNVHIVVFDGKNSFKVKEYNLHLKTYQSSDPTELKNIFRTTFNEGLSIQTFLYEGILGGLALIRQMPEKSNKFLIVFTDGKDINSGIKKDVVGIEAKGLKNFSAYAIDFMPSETTDKYLKSFCEANGGKIFKARSADNLLPIFKKVSTTLLHQYIVEYRFLNPPQGIFNLGAETLNFEALTTLDGRSLPYYIFFENGKSTLHPKYNLFADTDQINSFDEKQFNNAFDKYYSVLNITGKSLKQNPEASINIIGNNCDQGVEKDNLTLSENRAKSVQSYLHNIWGIDNSRMKIFSQGLPGKPALADALGSRSENQRVEIVFEPEKFNISPASDFKSELNNAQSLSLLPRIDSEYGLSNWMISVKSKNGIFKEIKGNTDLSDEYIIDLDKMGIQELSNLGYIQADINVADIYNDSFETSSQQCLINLVFTPVIHEFILPAKGSISVEPESVTIEEVTVIDSSPLLNYVFFNTKESIIPKQYTMLQNQAQAEKFDETKLLHAMSKYYNIVNIIGKRLLENPDATIKLVGCISNIGMEKNRMNLSKLRAEEVRAYLRYIWGISSDRIEVEARKLPAVPSSNRTQLGIAENQRVEIYSDSSQILDSIKSTYSFEVSDYNEIVIKPQIHIGYDLDSWNIDITGDGRFIKKITGLTNDISAKSFNLEKYGLKKIGEFNNISVQATTIDKKGGMFKTNIADTSIKYQKRVEQEAQKQGYKMLEKYALILFDYNSSAVKARNKIVLERVIKRIKELPSAQVSIVGHSDIIGKKDYNIALSLRRAKSVYKMVMQSDILSPERIIFSGDGPNNPPFDNATPEGRSFNRTVTISIEYEINQP